MIIALGIVMVFVGIVLAGIKEEIEGMNYKAGIAASVLSVVLVLVGEAITCGNAYEKLKSLELPDDWASQPSQPNNTAQEEKSHCSMLSKYCIVDEWSPVCLLKECIIDTRE